tara:strand:- start:955 stop:1557 length:603 start_codon:yes stop_codon:yes gene_type:complete
MHPIVLAITGASALELGERTLQLLLINEFSVYLVLSRGAYEVSLSERNQKIPVDSTLQEKFWRERLATDKGSLKCLKWNEHSASIASGSFKTTAMVIIPCTMGTLGRIASGYSLDLIERCADVHLKEGRKLILVPRESPLSLIHLKNMLTIVKAGGKIVPPSPAWYSKPKTVEDIIDFIVVRLFDLLDIDLAPIERWKGK